MKEIILASSSPRRQSLLKNLGISFSTISVNIDESFLPQESPRDAVRRLARLKAERAVTVLKEDCLLITADTIVVLDGQVMGKPGSEDDALEMLTRLSGRCQEVITAICIRTRARGCEVEDETTRVYFRPLSEEEIQAYIASGEPADKAGAYGIQGRGGLLVERIEGCYFNVVGLPLSRLYLMLKKHGINLLEV
ncbi:MAG: Maf family protein [Syntrophomonadaceae bacterium]|nr:Maf family protein [Syntrophomonadaceae bacterium]MDD3898197.1 Maf family protein [Syntrophomonadaceae bacterium]